ncbi:hypothetical protein ACFWS1_17735, partial [Streptomyces sp. NPDC058612]
TTINCPIGTVRSRVARARTTLITLLTDTTPPATTTTAPPAPPTAPHHNRRGRTAPDTELVTALT